MRKKILMLLLAVAAVAAAHGTPPADAASGCWRIPCPGSTQYNTCCQTSHGVVCTQLACP